MIPAHAIPWAILRLLLVMLLLGLAGIAALILIIALGVLRPQRMRDGRAMFFLRRLNPQDLGIAYEEMNFSVRDERTGRKLRINGWWMPEADESDRCAILLHGYGDSKIGSIAWAPLMRSLGFNMLAIDLRAHGYSQGFFTTAGFYERHDLMQVIDQLKANQPQRTRKIVLVGMSLGAAVAAATAVMRDDLSAVILECPYVDFPRAALSQGQRVPLPGGWVQRAALRLCAILSRADYSAVRPVDTIPKIPCPVFIVQSCQDSFVQEADRRLIVEAVGNRPADLPPARVWQVEDSFHILALPDNPQEYRSKLAKFLSQSIADFPRGQEAKAT